MSTFDRRADAHHALAREAAAESVVLLDERRHPAARPATPSIAVIGEFARTPRFQGAGSLPGQPDPGRDVLDELTAVYRRRHLRRRLRDRRHRRRRGAARRGRRRRRRRRHRRHGDRTARRGRVRGLRPHPHEPARQPAERPAGGRRLPTRTSSSCSSTDPPSSSATSRRMRRRWSRPGSAVRLPAPRSSTSSPARVNPSGRLAETIPHRLEDNSSYLNFPGDSQVVRYGEGLFIGYRGYDKAGTDVAFPFGFGLSYTTFELSDLTVAIVGLGRRRQPLGHRVTVTVANTGPVAGAEVVQVYVRDVESTVGRPASASSRASPRCSLDPGASQQVTDRARPARLLVLVGPARHVGSSSRERSPSRWAGSSRDLPLAQTVTVDGPSDRAAADHGLHPARVDGRPVGLSSSRRPSPRASRPPWTPSS